MKSCSSSPATAEETQTTAATPPDGQLTRPIQAALAQRQLLPSQQYVDCAYPDAATIKNRGHEVSVNLRPVQTADITWNVGLLWAKNTNRVTELQGATFVSIPNSGFTDPQGAAFASETTAAGVKYYPLGELRGTEAEDGGDAALYRGVIEIEYGDPLLSLRGHRRAAYQQR